jgi:hypothetical protein
MIAHVIGSFCADSAQVRDNRTVTIKTFFSSALDTGGAAAAPFRLHSLGSNGITTLAYK